MRTWHEVADELADVARRPPERCNIPETAQWVARLQSLLAEVQRTAKREARSSGTYTHDQA